MSPIDAGVGIVGVDSEAPAEVQDGASDSALVILLLATDESEANDAWHTERSSVVQVVASRSAETVDARAIGTVDRRTVEPQTASSARDATPSARPSKRLKSRGVSVSFGEVQILTHAPALDGCKVPSDGRAPMGLGPLESIDLRRMVSYDHERLAARRVRARSAALPAGPSSVAGHPSECACGSCGRVYEPFRPTSARPS